MRNDAQTRPEPDLTANPEAPAQSAVLPPRAWAKRASLVKILALVILVAATSWVVASWASGWLVPPYLVVMALLLIPAPGPTRRPGQADPAGSPPATADSDHPEKSDDRGEGLAARQNPSVPGLTLPTGATDPAGVNSESGDPGAATATATAPKPKRSRARPRKATKPLAEPVEVVEATWVEVGPGKFVRVETPSPTAPVAGPHLAVEPAPEPPVAAEPAPVAVSPAPVTLPEPASSGEMIEPELTSAMAPADRLAEVADDAVAPTAVANDAPEAAVARGLAARPDLGLDPGMFAEKWNLLAPTADGTAPQVAGQDELVFEAEPPTVAADPGLDLSPDDDALWPPDEAVEPSGSADLDAWAEPIVNGVDPTDVPPPLDDELSAEWELEAAAEQPADRFFPGPRVPRSTRRSRSGRSAPRGCPDGSARLGRPVVSSRRLSQRSAGRPRQISRTSPPRSPPSERSDG